MVLLVAKQQKAVGQLSCQPLNEKIEMEEFISLSEFFKYRRKVTHTLFLMFILFLLIHTPTLKADEPIYQCDNQTQTCITESEQQNNFLNPEQLNDQQLLQLPSSLPSWADFPQCHGKVLLSQASGFISDGPGNYSLDTKCTWVIQSRLPNSTIR